MPEKFEEGPVKLFTLNVNKVKYYNIKNNRFVSAFLIKLNDLI